MDKKIILDENEIPAKYYNILADLKTKMDPPLNPKTQEPAKPEDLSPIFAMELIKQEMASERYIDIPAEVREAYRIYRPSPLYRADGLEKKLGLNKDVKIYYKYEGVSPSGSHKLNTALPQAYYNKKEGVERLATETGAGQWGTALSFACQYFGMECMVYMVKCSFEQKPYRKAVIENFGAKIVASPSNTTEAGRAALAKDPNTAGTLGDAISEAIEDAAKHENTKYSLGSVLNHVMLHQTIIGQEAKKQMKIAGDKPDVVIACCGGGSNFSGISLPFIADKINNSSDTTRFIAVEPVECPTFTKGEYMYDFGDSAHLTPLLKMYSLGTEFMPANIGAGGLRYHGDSPIVSHLYHNKMIEARAEGETEIMNAAKIFARNEGILPAPESAYAIKVAIDEALEAKKKNEPKTILFNLSGHGIFDLQAYMDFNKK